jgi:hypothetical protein
MQILECLNISTAFVFRCNACELVKKLGMFKKVYSQPDMTLTKQRKYLSVPASMLMNTAVNKKNLFQLYVTVESQKEVTHFSI